MSKDARKPNRRAKPTRSDKSKPARSGPRKPDSYRKSPRSDAKPYRSERTARGPRDSRSASDRSYPKKSYGSRSTTDRAPRDHKPRRSSPGRTFPSRDDRHKIRNTSLPPYARNKPSQRAPRSSRPDAPLIKHGVRRSSIEPHRQLKGVYAKGPSIYTFSTSKQPVYGENIFKYEDGYVREWNPTRSKLGAGIVCDVSQIGIKPESKVLYLGAASGTTVSHVCDIVGKKGSVYAVEFSLQPVRRLMQLTPRYPQLVPIVADARKTEEYKKYIDGVDVVFQDVAQQDQVSIFTDNCETFLKKGGFGLLSLKAKSVDVTASPGEIFRKVEKQLEQVFTIVDKRKLDPLQKGHTLFVIKKK